MILHLIFITEDYFVCALVYVDSAKVACLFWRTYRSYTDFLLSKIIQTTLAHESFAKLRLCVKQQVGKIESVHSEADGEYGSADYPKNQQRPFEPRSHGLPLEYGTEYTVNNAQQRNTQHQGTCDVHDNGRYR